MACSNGIRKVVLWEKRKEKQNYRKAQGGNPYYIDRKHRRKLMEKKQAQGQKQDDQEPVQQL